MKRLVGVIVAGMVAMSVMGAGAASATPSRGGKATVWVLHAVPGAKVDVCVGSTEVKSNFTYGGKFSAKLPAGTYKLSIHAAKAGDCTGATIKAATVDLKANKNYTVVAGLRSKGSVALYAFKNDLSPIHGAKARVTVRHVAAAPSVDVWVNGSAAIKGFVPGEEATVALSAPADYTVRVAPKGTTTTVIGPRTFSLDKGMAYQVFAAGTADAGYRFFVLAQEPAA